MCKRTTRRSWGYLNVPRLLWWTRISSAVVSHGHQKSGAYFVVAGGIVYRWQRSQWMAWSKPSGSLPAIHLPASSAHRDVETPSFHSGHVCFFIQFPWVCLVHLKILSLGTETVKVLAASWCNDASWCSSFIHPSKYPLVFRSPLWRKVTLLQEGSQVWWLLLVIRLTWCRDHQEASSQAPVRNFHG